MTVSVSRAEAARGAVELQRMPPSVQRLWLDAADMDGDEGFDHEDSDAYEAVSDESGISYSQGAMWDETEDGGDDGAGRGDDDGGDRVDVEPRRLLFPPQLREILGFSFTGPADEVQLPPALTSLIFASDFNGDVGALQLPVGLRTLHFGYEFSQPIASLRLPASLTSLCLGKFHGTANDLPALPS